MERSAPYAKPLILCLEDNETYLRLRAKLLENEGFAVLSATTAHEALEIFRKAPVCLVLSDHMLRETTGTAVAKQMKKIKPNVPIVLYSGNPPDSMHPVDCFIHKTEPVTTFLSIIHDVLKRFRD